MQLKTLGSIVLLAASSAALAQMTNPSGRQGDTANTTANSGMNSGAPTTATNTSDETMMNGMSSPDGTLTPNSF